MAKYLWLEMLSQHTVGAKGAALRRGAGTGRQLAEAMPVGREGGKRAGEARRAALRAQREMRSTPTTHPSGVGVRCEYRKESETARTDEIWAKYPKHAYL